MRRSPGRSARSRSLRGAVLLLPALSLPCSAQAPSVVLESLSGELSSRPLAGLETKDPRGLGAHLVRFEGLELPALPRLDRDHALLELADGGKVLGRLRGGEDQGITLELLGGAALQVPIEAISKLAFPLRIPDEWYASFEAAAEGDRLYLFRAGGLDRLDGTVEGFSSRGVRFEGKLGRREVPWEEVSALLVEMLEEEARPQAGAGPRVSVDLVDGSRLWAELVLLTSEDLRLRTAGGRGLRLSLPVVSELVVVDERLRFLSDLEPSRVEEPSPFGDDLGMSWPHQRDRSVSGGPLRAGGRIFTRGLGVHAPSRLAYALDGTWKSLGGLVAIDDEVLSLAARGSVRFRILADGEQRWESPILRGGDAPLAIPALSLEGVRELVLEADPATDHFVADRANWLRVLLRR